MLVLSEVSELRWSDLVSSFKMDIFLFVKRSFWEAQRIPSLLIKSFWHMRACVRECILRGLCGRECPIGTSSFDDFKGKQLYFTWLWRSALVGNISFNRLTLVARVKNINGFVQPPVYFCPVKSRSVTFRVSLARKGMSSCSLVGTSFFVSEKRLSFMLRCSVSRTRVYSLREIQWHQQRERLRPRFLEADSASEMNA